MAHSSNGLTASVNASFEIADAVWDEDVHGKLAGLIGDQKVAAIARRFRADLQGRFSDPDDIERLRTDAHTVTSTAGMLGFTYLSNTARCVETACQSGLHATAPLASLLRAKEVAIDILDTRFPLS